MRRFLWVWAAFLWVGCSTETTAPLDAGAAPSSDAGAPPAEAGSIDASVSAPSDSGLLLDTGVSIFDAMSPLDAGEQPSDPLDAILDAWFANYNEGQGLDYLQGLGFDFPDGDPEVTEFPPHRHVRGATYGPYSRNLMDFWMPVADQPTPVAVFIHGGGFVGGSVQRG